MRPIVPGVALSAAAAACAMAVIAFSDTPASRVVAPGGAPAMAASAPFPIRDDPTGERRGARVGAAILLGLAWSQR